MIKIIFENSNYVVCVKPVGYVSQLDSVENMVTALSEQLNCDIFPVHRLDTGVSGIMIYAKNHKTAAFLSKQITENTFNKQYIAVIDGILTEKKEILEDLLFKDSRKNKSFVVKRMRNGVKKAKLEYTVLGEYEGKSLVKVKLYTGRTHQIRVQFASRKHPLIGDSKYGSKVNNTDIALFSYKLSFVNELKEKEVYSTVPDTEKYPWNEFADIISSL